MMDEIKREIRELTADELGTALDLVWDVFAASIAPAVSDEAIDEFWSAIDYEYMLHRFGDGQVRFWGALEDGAPVGVCAVRDLQRIMLLFVTKEHQGRGVGSALLKKAVMDCKARDGGLDRVTLGALPGSVGFFEKLGFRAVGAPDGSDPLQAVPMALGPLFLSNRQKEWFLTL